MSLSILEKIRLSTMLRGRSTTMEGIHQRVGKQYHPLAPGHNHLMCLQQGLCMLLSISNITTVKYNAEEQVNHNGGSGTTSLVDKGKPHLVQTGQGLYNMYFNWLRILVLDYRYS